MKTMNFTLNNTISCMFNTAIFMALVLTLFVSCTAESLKYIPAAVDTLRVEINGATTPYLTTYNNAEKRKLTHLTCGQKEIGYTYPTSHTAVIISPAQTGECILDEKLLGLPISYTTNDKSHILHIEYIQTNGKFTGLRLSDEDTKVTTLTFEHQEGAQSGPISQLISVMYLPEIIDIFANTQGLGLLISHQLKMAAMAIPFDKMAIKVMENGEITEHYVGEISYGKDFYECQLVLQDYTHLHNVYLSQNETMTIRYSYLPN